MDVRVLRGLRARHIHKNRVCRGAIGQARDDLNQGDHSNEGRDGDKDGLVRDGNDKDGDSRNRDGCDQNSGGDVHNRKWGQSRGVQPEQGCERP